MFNTEFELKLFAAIAFLFTFILLIQTLSASNLLTKVKLICNSLFEIDYNLTRSMNATSNKLSSLIVLFYLIYFMFFKSILLTNISTNRVIVDSSMLVDTREDLLNKKKDHLLLVFIIILIHYKITIKSFFFKLGLMNLRFD